MAPKYIIPLHEMPKLPSGESNRKELRAIASSMIALELSKYALDSTNTSGLRITPQFSDGEDAPRNLGANIGYRGRSILPTSRLLNLGRNSITAINLASHLRKNGHALSLRVALKFTNLKEMAKTPNHHPPQNPHPLSSNLLSSRKSTYLCLHGKRCYRPHCGGTMVTHPPPPKPHRFRPSLFWLHPRYQHALAPSYKILNYPSLVRIHFDTFRGERGWGVNM